MEELKPCPFCGEDNKLVADYEGFDSSGSHYASIHCENCGANSSGGIGDSKESALAAASIEWNDRAGRDESVTSGQREELLAIADDLAMVYEIRCGLLMTGSSGNVLCGEQLARSMRDYEIACRIRRALGVPVE